MSAPVTGGAGRLGGPVELRPHYTVPLAVPRERAMKHIRDRLNETVPDRWVGKGRWAEVHVPGEERRIWSPYLSLRLDQERPDDPTCSVYARFAPRPEIWTGVVFLYSAILFAVVFGAVFGYVQWASDESAWGLWIAAAGVPALGGIHLAGAVGRRLSRDQMRELQGLLDPVLDGIGAGAPE